MAKNWYVYLLLTVTLMACSKREKADLIVTNAKIYTVDSTFSTHSSMAVVNGIVKELGDSVYIMSKYTAKKVVDAGGMYVYPGFIDSHCHFLGYGLSLNKAMLSEASSWDEVVARLVEHQKRFPTSWVEGRGWNQNEWKVREFPTNELLNRAFPDKPVYIVRIDGHAAIANNAALKIAGVTASTRVEGGEVVLQKGKPTGMLLDNAMELVRRIIPKPTIDEKAAALQNAQKKCFAVGLTGVQDAGLDVDEVLLIDSLQQSGKMEIWVNAMLNPTPANYEKFISKGVYQTNKLTVRSIKLYADGALGSRGALLLEPYSDDRGNRGLQVEPTEKLDSLCGMAFKAGYQVCTHCIGDAAVKLMLDIYSKYLPAGNILRWRIEHAQVVDRNDLPRFGSLAVIPSVQTTHATSDMDWADERLGSRIKNAYAYQELLLQNGWIANGSDFPIESINPLYGFYAGVARKNLDGKPDGGFQPENALIRKQALCAMTIWAAKAAFCEDARGSLEPGKAADFVILNTDLMNDELPAIPRATILKTFVSGKEVFGSNAFSHGN